MERIHLGSPFLYYTARIPKQLLDQFSQELGQAFGNYDIRIVAQKELPTFTAVQIMVPPGDELSFMDFVSNFCSKNNIEFCDRSPE